MNESTDDDREWVKIKIPAGMIVKLDGIPVQLWNSVVVTTHRGNLGNFPSLRNRTDVPVGPINEPLDGEKPSEKLPSVEGSRVLVKGMTYLTLLALILFIWWAVIVGGLKL